MLTKVQVWSTGLEEWEDALMPTHMLKQLTYVHDKTIGYELFSICKDSTDRWIKVPVGAFTAQEEKGRNDASE